MYMNCIEYSFDVTGKTKLYVIDMYINVISYMYMNLTYIVCI